MTYRRLYDKLLFLNYIINQEIGEPLNDYSASREDSNRNFQSDQQLQNYQLREIGVLHNNYRYEQELLRNITLGKDDKIRQLDQKTSYIFKPKYSYDELRTLKDDFIMTATLVSRAAISGGLDIETSLLLCDGYIVKAEQMVSMERIHNLYSTMLEDYVSKTAKLSLPQETPSLIVECVQYICSNIANDIRTQGIADHFGMRREYLSTRFKQYTGFPISEFINHQRIENAKALLKYTDISLSEISNHLCFSEQSHFQRVFKKYTGMTPVQYRKMNL